MKSQQLTAHSSIHRKRTGLTHGSDDLVPNRMLP
jgi:hypothetical protein